MYTPRGFPTFRKTLRKNFRAENLPVFPQSVFLGVFSIFPPRTFYRPSVDKLRELRRFSTAELGGNKLVAIDDFSIKLGNCCALVSNSVMYMAKRVLNIRLTHFQHLDNQSLGFIPDINRVLTKYALHHALDRYLSDGVFPCMHVKESF